MPLPTASVLGILADNLRLRGSVLPLSEKKAVGWAEGLDIKRGGETVLYTGHLYQLMPAIAALESALITFEDNWLNKLTGVGRAANKIVNLSGLMALEKRRDREVCEQRLVNIVRLLRAAKVDFGYLYEEELYSGALIHDEGLDVLFAEHARKVAEVFRRNGVKQVITVDPHTTNILRSVFPEVVPDLKLTVKSYLEVLAEHPSDSVRVLDRDLVIHDSCVYARHESVVEEPRLLLQRAGVRVLEPASNRRRTLCCGGPIESLFPSRAKSICRRRLKELGAAGKHIVAMCPICLLNLERTAEADKLDLMLGDINEVLVEAYC
jgi:Fe-S oxidoreductase